MSLAAVLSRQCGESSALLALLREEQDVLLRPEVEGPELESIAAAKQQCFEQLEQSEQERCTLLRDLGQPFTREGSLAAAREAGCEEAWLHLQDLLRQASHLNMLNGSLVQQRLVHNQRVLDALARLRGHSLYGAKGQPGQNRGSFQSKA